MVGKLSVALITAVRPYPVDAGKKVMLAGFVEYFRHRLGDDRVHYLLVGDQAGPRPPLSMHPIPKPGKAAVIGNVLTRVATGRDSLQVSLLRSRRTGTAIARTLDQLAPSLELYDTVRMAQYARGHDSDGQICYLDDLFSERYKRMLAARKRYGDVNIRPLGNFAEHVPARLRPLADHRQTQGALLQLESILVGRSEDQAARTFRRSLLVNSAEAEILTKRSGVTPNRIRVIPPLIATPTVARREYRGAPEFVFLGLLSLPHNDDGLRTFVTTVWPTVLAARPDARLRVIGRNPRPELIRLTERYGGSVSIEGYVPDLTEALGRAAALINPLRFGSGVKLKVIEALGRGLPVVSTPVGADGIQTGPASGVLVGAQPDEIVELMGELTDRRRNTEVSEAALAHFRAKYSRSAVFDSYDAAFGLN